MTLEKPAAENSTVQNTGRFVSHLPAVMALLLIGGLLYSAGLGAPWYFDDYPNIVSNEKIRDLWQTAGNFFSPRGLAYLSFALDYHFWQLSPDASRLVNIGLHLTNGLLVYLLLQVLLKSRHTAFWVALIFLGHPLQTQAVTYIVQRMTILSCLFFLLSLWLYYSGRKRLVDLAAPRRRSAWLCLGGAFLCGLCSILSKENTAVLPLILLLVEVFFVAPGKLAWKQRLLFVLPFFLVPLAGLLLQVSETASTIKAIDNSIEYFVYAADGSGRVLVDYHPEKLQGRYLATQAVVIWQYVGLFFWPLQQALDYCYPLVDSLFNWRSLLGATGVFALLAVAWRLRRLRPLISFGVGWFLLLLAVESSVIPLDAFFEHRMYLPLVGLGLAVVDVGNWLLPRKLMLLLCILFVGPLLLLSWQRNQLWTDEVAFWEDNIHNQPLAYRPYGNLGKAYYLDGDLLRARDTFSKALQLNPAAARIYIDLGSVLDELGQRAQAVALLEKALSMEGQRSRAAYNLGVLYEKSGEYATAGDYYRQTSHFNPKNYQGYFGLGVVFYHQGDLTGALAQFATAKHLAPHEADVLFNYASVALELGRVAEARSYLPQLRRLDEKFYRLLQKELVGAGQSQTQ